MLEPGLGDANAEQYHCRDKECLARLEAVVGWRVNANTFVHDMNHRQGGKKERVAGLRSFWLSATPARMSA
eukprot:gene86-biopygen3043